MNHSCITQRNAGYCYEYHFDFRNFSRKVHFLLQRILIPWRLPTKGLILSCNFNNYRKFWEASLNVYSLTLSVILRSYGRKRGDLEPVHLARMFFIWSKILLWIPGNFYFRKWKLPERLYPHFGKFLTRNLCTPLFCFPEFSESSLEWFKCR